MTGPHFGLADIQAQLKAFILGEFLAGQPEDALATDDDLLDLGLIDSMGALDIAGFIETTFGVKVGDEDITLTNFRTIGNLAAFVLGRLTAGSPRG
jgi:acyl carrier protein